MFRTLLAALACACFSASPALAQSTRVVIETELGPIEVALEPERAPGTVANFLRYVDEGLYDGGRFHRAVTMENQVRQDVKIEVIQGSRSPESVTRTPNNPAIPLERTSVTGLKHVDGAISMARNSADSAVSDFFICINDQPSLDYGGPRNADGQGFAAFGRVVRGMDVVRKIQQSPADAKEQLTPPIRIVRIARVR